MILLHRRARRLRRFGKMLRSDRGYSTSKSEVSPVRLLPEVLIGSEVGMLSAITATRVMRWHFYLMGRVRHIPNMSAMPLRPKVRPQKSSQQFAKRTTNMGLWRAWEASPPPPRILSSHLRGKNGPPGDFYMSRADREGVRPGPSGFRGACSPP